LSDAVGTVLAEANTLMIALLAHHQ
jgi:hypothetical protein